MGKRRWLGARGFLRGLSRRWRWGSGRATFLFSAYTAQKVRGVYRPIGRCILHPAFSPHCTHHRQWKHHPIPSSLSTIRFFESMNMLPGFLLYTRYVRIVRRMGRLSRGDAVKIIPLYFQVGCAQIAGGALVKLAEPRLLCLSKTTTGQSPDDPPP